MKKVLLITVIYLLFIGCSSREPITWGRRILESKVSPVEFGHIVSMEVPKEIRRRNPLTYLSSQRAFWGRKEVKVITLGGI